MPSIYVLTRTQTLPIAPEAAWAFFSNPANLSAITPPGLGFRVLSDPPPAIYAGLMLRYSVRPLPGFRTIWVSEITQARAPEYFVDEQRFGTVRAG
jgi:ligand-binding SRPBCC domain-containing protein